MSTEFWLTDNIYLNVADKGIRIIKYSEPGMHVHIKILTKENIKKLVKWLVDNNV
jgi:hypothetical protein